jgi:hypothetical protein
MQWSTLYKTENPSSPNPRGISISLVGGLACGRRGLEGLGEAMLLYMGLTGLGGARWG